MHKHHIIPVHMGGTNDPSNFVEVTVEEHAELHFALYLEHGRWQDWLAAHGLAGLIDREEMAKKAVSLSRKGKAPWNKGIKTGPNPKVSEARRKIEANRVWTEEQKEKCREAGRKNKGRKRPDLAKRNRQTKAAEVAKRPRDSNGRFIKCTNTESKKS